MRISNLNFSSISIIFNNLYFIWKVNSVSNFLICKSTYFIRINISMSCKQSIFMNAACILYMCTVEHNYPFFFKRGVSLQPSIISIVIFASHFYSKSVKSRIEIIGSFRTIWKFSSIILLRAIECIICIISIIYAYIGIYKLN
jgi:hypothetical protein